MRLVPIHTGNFKLDGGAMFGTVPKSIWKNINPADENNMCNWAMRCLLIEDGNRLVLIDNGMGEKQSEKFFGYYYLNGIYSLQKSLNNAGVDFSDITDVVLTHLHLTTVEEAYNGIHRKININLLSQTQLIGFIQNIGIMHSLQIPEKKRHF